MNGIYWKLLTPGNYLVKAVVFSKDGKEVTKNDWSNASPSMESLVQKVEVKNRNKSSSLRNGRRPERDRRSKRQGNIQYEAEDAGATPREY